MNKCPRQSCTPQQNHLLASLPFEDLAPWDEALDPIELSQGEVLCESGSTADYAYFPTTAIVSLLYLTQDGESTETAVVGLEGVVGLALFMGGNASPSRPGPIRTMLLRYTQTLMEQVAQTAAFNRYHSIDQLLCRRLLLGLDRLPSDALMMTQELLANLLGVRREGVTAAALKLSQAGLISYSRGRIAVLDRVKLEQRCGNPA